MERQVKAMERQKQALRLRQAGVSYPDIAEALGYKHPSGAAKAVSSALKKTLREPADELRQLELTRLDTMLFAIWPYVRAGNAEFIDRALKIMDARAKLLGLYPPLRVAANLEEQIVVVGLGVDTDKL